MRGGYWPEYGHYGQSLIRVPKPFQLLELAELW